VCERILVQTDDERIDLDVRRARNTGALD